MGGGVREPAEGIALVGSAGAAEGREAEGDAGRRGAGGDPASGEDGFSGGAPGEDVVGLAGVPPVGEPVGEPAAEPGDGVCRGGTTGMSAVNEAVPVEGTGRDAGGGGGGEVADGVVGLGAGLGDAFSRSSSDSVFSSDGISSSESSMGFAAGAEAGEEAAPGVEGLTAGKGVVVAKPDAGAVRGGGTVAPGVAAGDDAAGGVADGGEAGAGFAGGAEAGGLTAGDAGAGGRGAAAGAEAAGGGAGLVVNPRSMVSSSSRDLLAAGSRVELVGAETDLEENGGGGAGDGAGIEDGGPACAELPEGDALGPAGGGLGGGVPAVAGDVDPAGRGGAAGTGGL